MCFVSLNSYYFFKDREDIAGGAELQQFLLAKEFLKKDYDICFIVQDDEGICDRDGIKAVKSFRKDGTKYIRFFGNILKLFKAMDKADSEIYYQRSGTNITFWVCLFCKLKKKKFVFSISHDDDCTFKSIRRSRFDNFLYRMAIKGADAILSQSAAQQTLLKERFNIDSHLIKNGIVISENSPKKEDFVLWVANIRKWKRPELYLELARSLPGYRFVMVGGSSGDDDYFEEIKRKAKAIKNLEFIGFLPHGETDKVIGRARVMVSTALQEGFPNTFLHAWNHHTTVLTLTVDPDETICKHRLGIHSGDFERMRNDLEMLMGDQRLREELGDKGYNYIKQEHDIINNADKCLDVIRGVM